MTFEPAQHAYPRRLIRVFTRQFMGNFIFKLSQVDNEVSD